MLVLSRKDNQTIVITCPGGEEITLTVVRIRGDMAQLGIDAPLSFRVHRGEIQQLIDEQSGSAVAS